MHTYVARVSVLVAAAVSVLLFSFFLLAHESYAATCDNYYNSSTAIPDGFAAPFNLFSQTKELLIRADLCDFGVARLKVGKQGDNNIYVYNTGYYWANSRWNAFQFDGDDKAVDWFMGLAVGAPTVTAPGTFVVAYTCHLITLTDWRCGCVTQDCLESEGEGSKWGIQYIKTNQVCNKAVCKAPTLQKSHKENCDTCGYTNCDKYNVPLAPEFVNGHTCWELDTADSEDNECWMRIPQSVNDIQVYACRMTP